VQIGVVARADAIDFCVGTGSSSHAPLRPVTLDSVKGVENRLVVMYVQELAESWGGTLKIGDDSFFVVTVPQTREGS